MICTFPYVQRHTAKRYSLCCSQLSNSHHEATDVGREPSYVGLQAPSLQYVLHTHHSKEVEERDMVQSESANTNSVK